MYRIGFVPSVDTIYNLNFHKRLLQKRSIKRKVNNFSLANRSADANIDKMQEFRWHPHFNETKFK